MAEEEGGGGGTEIPSGRLREIAGADDPTPKQLLKGLSGEDLQGYLTHLELIDTKLGVISEKKAKLIVQERDTIALLRDQDKVTEIINSKTEQRGEAEGARLVALDAEIAQLRNLAQEAETSRRRINKVYGETKEEYRTSKEHLQDVYRDSKRTSAELRQISIDTAELGENNGSLIKSTDDIIRMAEVGVQGLSHAMAEVSLEAAAMAMFIPGMAPSSFLREMEDLPNSLDKSFRSLTKSGVKHTEEMDTAFVSMLDPLHAVRTGALAIGDADEMFVNVGLKAEDAQKSMSALRNGTMFMREEFIKAEPATAAYVSNLVAGLGKIGVSHQSSAKALDQFTKVLGQSPRKAATSLKQVVGVARSLDMNVGEAVKNFTTMMPKLAEWGDRAVDVFANLQAQSRATGISVEGLNSVAMRLDTFKGAAEAAQGFNAVMGDTLLSVTDLVHAEPDEKIEMMREAMDRSGTSFENANRRVRSMIASMMGVDVGTAARMFGSEEDFETAKDRLSTEAASKEELDSAIDASLTAAERAKKSVSSLVGGADKLVKRSHKVAGEFASAATKGIGKAIAATGKHTQGVVNTEEAYISLMGVMGVIAKKAPKKTARAALGVVTGVAALGGATQKRLYDMEEKAHSVGMWEPYGMFDVGEDGVVGDPEGAGADKGTPPRSTAAPPRPRAGGLASVSPPPQAEPGRLADELRHSEESARGRPEAVVAAAPAAGEVQGVPPVTASPVTPAPPVTASAAAAALRRDRGLPPTESPEAPPAPLESLLAALTSLVKSLEASRNIPVEIPIQLLAAADGQELAKWVEKRSLNAVNRALG